MVLILSYRTFIVRFIYKSIALHNLLAELNVRRQETFETADSRVDFDFLHIILVYFATKCYGFVSSAPHLSHVWLDNGKGACDVCNVFFYIFVVKLKSLLL